MNEQTYLGSRYHLEERIGRGPSGTVYRAMDIERGEQVAVKVIDKQYAGDPRFAIRFREHLKTLLGLSHDNLVVPYDYGYLDDRYYIASELVDGVDLGTYLAAHGPLSAAEATGITGQVCAALEEVHRRDLIHRGIKPTNILLIGEGLVKVTDVGLDGVISETGLSKTKRLLGGVKYLSPEQARGERIGPESDLYSLGVTLFQMLTDRLPFESNNAWSLVRLHAMEAPPWPRDINRAVPLGLEGVVMRALQKTAPNRYSTASEMATALSTASIASETLTPALRKLPRVARAGLRSRVRGWMTGTPGPIFGHRLVMHGPLGRPVIFGAGLALQFLTSFLIAVAALYALSGVILRDGLGPLGLAEALGGLRDAGAPMVIPEMTMTAPASAPSEPTPSPQPPDARLTPTLAVPATPTEEPTASATSTNTLINTPKPTNTLEPAASPSCGELYAEKVLLKGDRFEIKVRNDSSAAAYLNYSTLEWNTDNAPPMRFEKFEFQGNRYYKSSSYTSPVSASAPSIALAAGRGETWKAVFKLEDQPLEGYYSATLIFDFPGWGTCTVFGELSEGP